MIQLTTTGARTVQKAYYNIDKQLSLYISTQRITERELMDLCGENDIVVWRKVS